MNKNDTADQIGQLLSMADVYTNAPAVPHASVSLSDVIEAVKILADAVRVLAPIVLDLMETER